MSRRLRCQPMKFASKFFSWPILSTNMFVQLNETILTRMSGIWLFRYLIELHCEISIYTFPGGNLEIYLKSILSFVTFKMLILLKFYRIISSVLYRLCSVLISFKFIKSLICNFLKFRESMTSMMRICLLRASTNGILLWKF